MVTYAKEEMVSMAELGKSLGSYLDKVTTHVFDKIAIIRKDKPEAVIIPVEEYELLQSAYDKLEQEEIEQLLSSMSAEDKEVSKIKTISVDL